MAEKHGWIALHRKIQDHSFWQQKRTFSKAEAWIDILMEARWKDEPKEFIIGNTRIICKRGQVCYSIGTWAERWSWPRTTVHRFLKLLVKTGQIVSENVTKTVRITVVNYEHYQNVRNANGTEVERTRNARGTQTDTTEQGKQRKEGKQRKKTPKLDDPDFIVYWEAYPRKVGKGNARRAFENKKKQEILPEISILVEAVERQKKCEQWQKNGGQYIPYPATWLNQERWLDEPKTGYDVAEKLAELAQREATNRQIP